MVLVVSLMCVTVEVSHSTNCGRTSDNTLSGRNMVCVIPVSFATTQNILFKHIKHIYCCIYYSFIILPGPGIFFAVLTRL